MNQTNLPSAPVAESLGVNSPPPSYDEAMGNTATIPGDQNNPNNVQTSETLQDENELKKRAPPPLITTQPLPVPVPETTYAFQQPVTQQPRNDDCLVCIYCLHPDDVADCCYCIFCCSRHVTGHDAGCCECGDGCCGRSRHVTGHDAGCCECGDGCCGRSRHVTGHDAGCCECGDGCCGRSRHVTGHDAGCCECGDGCCGCPEGCCECGDCDCDCGDCNCDDCDCDCGDCDCSGCDCGDCTIM